MRSLTPFVRQCYRFTPFLREGVQFESFPRSFEFAVSRRIMRTYFPKKGDVEPRWFVIDAEGKVLGRLSTMIANIITGKAKPTYTPFLDTGDHVIVINAEKIRLSGKKETDKIYHHHSLYPGGLPKNKLGRKMLKKLKVYRGTNHPHQAQKPEPIDVAE